MTQHRFASNLRLLRTLATASVVGSALVLSIATSPAETPLLSTAGTVEPVVIAEGEDSAERTFTVRIDEGALAIEGNETTVNLLLCGIDEAGQPAERCYNYVDDESILPDGVIVELFLDDASDPADTTALKLGGSIASLEALLFEAGQTEQTLTARFTRAPAPEPTEDPEAEDPAQEDPDAEDPDAEDPAPEDPAPTVELPAELRIEAVLSVTTRFESLGEDDWDQIEGLELTLDGDIVDEPTEEDPGAEQSDDNATTGAEDGDGEGSDDQAGE